MPISMRIKRSSLKGPSACYLLKGIAISIDYAIDYSLEEIVGFRFTDFPDASERVTEVHVEVWAAIQRGLAYGS